MSEMTEQESFERFDEGLKQAADRARELGKLQENKGWGQFAYQLDCLRKTGTAFYKQSPLTRQMALNMLDERMARERSRLH